MDVMDENSNFSCSIFSSGMIMATLDVNHFFQWFGFFTISINHLFKGKWIIDLDVNIYIAHSLS